LHTLGALVWSLLACQLEVEIGPSNN
jgi:hypothetical protein